jgi:hypothetical protein
MLAALERLLYVVVTHEKLFPSLFAFDFEIIPGVPVQEHREVHSIVLPDREGFYTLLGGENRCILEKDVPTKDKSLHQSDLVDVRHHGLIKTTSHGVIKIIKRDERKDIIEYLGKLQKFLQMHSGELVEKRLT